MATQRELLFAECDPALCPPVVWPRDLEIGQEVVMSPVGCCSSLKPVCFPEKCPPAPQCPENTELVATPGACCNNYKCSESELAFSIWNINARQITTGACFSVFLVYIVTFLAMSDYRVPDSKVPKSTLLFVLQTTMSEPYLTAPYYFRHKNRRHLR